MLDSIMSALATVQKFSARPPPTSNSTEGDVNEILDALGWIGDSLDKPGRAVRGVLAGKPQELLSAIPFSDTLGITNPEDRTSGVDVLRAIGADPGDGAFGGLAGFATEMALDPTTYLGGFAGRMLGKAADAAQIARGPRFATTGMDLAKAAVEARPDDHVVETVNRLLGRRSVFDDAASQIPSGSSYLGGGVEGLAFKSPAGDVYRVAEGVPAGTAGRPTASPILQPISTTDIPYKRPNDIGGIDDVGFRVERLPLAGNVDDTAFWRNRDPKTFLSRMQLLRDESSKAGIPMWDVHTGNVGTLDGVPKIIDPGAVNLDAYAGGFNPVVRRAQPGVGMAALLSALGGDQALQKAVLSGGTSPGFANKLTAYGALAGAVPGRFGGG